MLRVRDIMTPGVFTLATETAADEAAWGLTWRHLGGAPVRDGNGRLVGMLSKTDLVDPQPKDWIKGEATVGDLMHPDVLAVYADDPALSAVAAMAKNDVHRIVVIGPEGDLVGIVSALDVVKAMAAGRSFDVEIPDETVAAPAAADVGAGR
jgi:CBS-domain-containing membrane protein